MQVGGPYLVDVHVTGLFTDGLLYLVIQSLTHSFITVTNSLCETLRWEAHIWVKELGRQVYLGGYEHEEHAAEAYDVAALKCKGFKVKTNFDIDRCGASQLYNCCPTRLTYTCSIQSLRGSRLLIFAVSATQSQIAATPEKSSACT